MSMSENHEPTDLQKLSALLVPLGENFGRLVEELENEKLYRKEARKRTQSSRVLIAVAVCVAFMIAAGISYLNNKVVRSIKDCTTAPKEFHRDPKDYTCYEKSIAQQSSAFITLRDQTDQVVRQRNQELLDALRKGEVSIKNDSLPPIIVVTPTTTSPAGTTTSKAGTTTTTAKPVSPSTTTTAPSPSSTAPTSTSTTSTSSTTVCRVVNPANGKCLSPR